MKNIVRLILFSILFAGQSGLAQQARERADFDCLMLANSSGIAPAGQKGAHASFHHVWIPDLKYGEFESNGVGMFFEMEGVGKEVVIVVHGGPGLPHEYFHPMLSSLGRYVKLVYFDRRANMLSARSPFQIAPASEMADDIDSLRSALGLSRVTLLAHSFGGSIALTYALKYPDRVKRLILVGTSSWLENPADIEKRVAKSLSPKEAALYQSNEGRPAETSACDTVRRRYRALYPRYFHKAPDDRTLDVGVYSIYFDALARKMALATDAASYDLRGQIDQIKVPTLVITGRHDLVTPVNLANEVSEEMPNARLVVLGNSGHFPFFEESFLFNEWVRQFIAHTADMFDDRSSPAAIVSSTPSKTK